MTGSNVVDTLVLFLMTIIAIVFLGKLVLRRAGRTVVKVYQPVSPPIVVLPPMYSAPFPPQLQYPGMGYPVPPAAYPPAYPAVPIEQQQHPGIAPRPLSEGEQFDQIVDGFYER